jgi:HAD superfamily hydrolase (TIGR01509 family)
LTPADFRPFIGTGAVRYVEGPAERIGLKIDLEKALKVRLRNFEALLDAGECKPCPGALELIHLASADGHWKLAIATSSPEKKANYTLQIVRVPIERFAAVITGDMVTHKKPHPEIYELALIMLGLPASRCVVIEDAVTGVASAKAAGLPCLAVTSSFTAPELAQADKIVDSLEHVGLDTLRELVSPD